MRAQIAVGIIVGIVVTWPGAAPAVSFRNMDFEEAIPDGDCLPHWSADTKYGPGYNSPPTLGSAQIRVVGLYEPPGSPYPGTPALEGDYSVILTGGWDMDADVPRDSSIFQTGGVPADAQWIYFIARSDWLPQTADQCLRLSLGGQEVPLELLTPGANFRDVVKVRGDVSAFAGQEVELKLTAFSVMPQQSEMNIVAVDSLRFVSVPEPLTLTGVALGIAVLGSYVRRRGSARGSRTFRIV